MTALLYPYQQRWLEDDSRFKLGLFARQTGKTFTTTLEIAQDAAFADLEGRRVRWVILSRGERQAREAMDEGVKMHLRAMGAGFAAMESDFRLQDTTTVRALEVEFAHGSKITALPANPDTARGFSANVFLDEFGFHKDSHAIWRALFPVVSKPGLKLRVTSTPNGKGNKFYELMTGEADIWSRHTVDIYRAVQDGLPRDVDALKEALNDDDAWRQEYELEWLDEASAWLPWELINGVEHDQAGNPEHYTGGPCYVGVDIGRRKDLFVIWVAELIGDVLWTREIIERRGASFAEQDQLLDGVFQRYRVMRCCMDQTGMGEKPVEDAQRRHGTTRVEGVLFTGPNKLALATICKQRFEDRTLRIPLGNQALRTDLHKLQKVSGPTGAPRFVAESDAGGHADRAWACFLACNAAENGGFKIEFQRAGRRASFGLGGSMNWEGYL